MDATCATKTIEEQKAYHRRIFYRNLAVIWVVTILRMTCNYVLIIQVLSYLDLYPFLLFSPENYLFPLLINLVFYNV